MKIYKNLLGTKINRLILPKMNTKEVILQEFDNEWSCKEFSDIFNRLQRAYKTKVYVRFVKWGFLPHYVEFYIIRPETKEEYSERKEELLQQIYEDNKLIDKRKVSEEARIKRKETTFRRLCGEYNKKVF